MLRFTIRDVLWVMVVVGLGAGWMTDHLRLSRDKNALSLMVARGNDSVRQLIVRLDKLDPDWREK